MAASNKRTKALQARQRGVGSCVGLHSGEVTGASLNITERPRAHSWLSQAGLGGEDTKVDLDTLLSEAADPLSALRQYPQIFRRSLETANKLCLCSFMSAV